MEEKEPLEAPKLLIKVLYTLNEADNKTRRISVAINGKVTEVTMDSVSASSKGEFNKMLYKQSSLVYTGSQMELIAEIAEALADEGTREVDYVYHQGRIPGTNIWIFPEFMVFRNQVLKPDKDGIFWPTKIKGYKQAFLMDADTDSITNMMDFKAETVSTKVGNNLVPTWKVHLSNWLLANYNNIGDMAGLYLAAFQKMSLYGTEIFDRYRCVPIGFITGKTQSGKNVLTRQGQMIFGYTQREGDSLFQSTAVGLERRLTYYSDQPFWSDEFRGGDKKLIFLNSYMRAIFGRASVSKGVKESFGLRSSSIHGTWFITGESLPADPALRSRFFVLYLNKKTRKEHAFNESLKMAKNLPSVGLGWLKEKSAKKSVIPVGDINTAIDMFDSKIEGTTEKSRMSLVYGIVHAFAWNIAEDLHNLGLLPDSYMQEIEPYIFRQVESEYITRDSEGLINQWWDVFDNLIFKNPHDGGLEKNLEWQVEDDLLYFNYSKCWTKIYRLLKLEDATTDITKTDMKTYIKMEYNLKSSQIDMQKKFNGKNGRFTPIPLAMLPEFLTSTLQTAKSLDNTLPSWANGESRS